MPAMAPGSMSGRHFVTSSAASPDGGSSKQTMYFGVHSSSGKLTHLRFTHAFTSVSCFELVHFCCQASSRPFLLETDSLSPKIATLGHISVKRLSLAKVGIRDRRPFAV